MKLHNLKPSESKRIIMLAAMLLCFMTGCRELAEPTNGYIIVPWAASPITIRTKNLEGVGWIQAYTTAKQWEVIHLSPSGAFTYQDPLPANAWHCNGTDPTDCVAALRVGDEKGRFSTRAAGSVIYVCTSNYVQKLGKKHCGDREFQPWAPFGTASGDPVSLSYYATDGPFREEFTSDDLYEWHGDSYSRAVSGYASFPDADTWRITASKWPENVPTSRWSEFPYTPGGPLVVVDGYDHTINYDLGACHLFLPYEWKNRINDFFTLLIGEKTAPQDCVPIEGCIGPEQYCETCTPIPNADGSVGRGFAEILLDGIMETEKSVIRIDNAKRWLDTVTGIWRRSDASPEFHFRLYAPENRNTLEPQFCIKDYMRADNTIKASPDSWYRWDQAFASAWIKLFGIGDCRAKSWSLMYCGTPRMGRIWDGTDGVRFETADDVYLAHEGYPLQPACNKKFVDPFLAEVEKGVHTAGRQNMEDGLTTLVRGLEETVNETWENADNFKVRRLEFTPTGIYVVTANTVSDPQYELGVGNCLGDLTSSGPRTRVTQPKKSAQYMTRGIQREVP